MDEEDILVGDEYLGDLSETENEEGNTGYTSLEVFLKEYDTLKRSYKTSPVLSKYEKTKILSERAQQINDGSPIFVELREGESTSAYKIAMRELEEKKIPFLLKRPYGSTYEYWKVKDLF